VRQIPVIFTCVYDFYLIFKFFIYHTLLIWRDFIVIIPYMYTVYLNKFIPFITFPFPSFKQCLVGSLHPLLMYIIFSIWVFTILISNKLKHNLKVLKISSIFLRIYFIPLNDSVTLSSLSISGLWLQTQNNGFNHIRDLIFSRTRKFEGTHRYLNYIFRNLECITLSLLPSLAVTSSFKCKMFTMLIGILT
jgi:hypothetical protein